VTNTFVVLRLQPLSDLVLGGVPVDALAIRLDTTRNALYKPLSETRGPRMTSNRLVQR
jgi:hypothetical protein